MNVIKITYIALAISLVLSTSCKKKIYGCKDSNAKNYSSVANEDSKSCIYDDEEIIVSNTILGASWQQSGQTYEMVLNWAEINQSVIDNGTVDAYVSEEGIQEWNPLPVTLYLSDQYSSTISVTYSLGKVVLTWTDSDLTTPIQPVSLDVKLVIHK